MRDDARTWKEGLVRDLGEEKVTAYEPPDGVHVPLLFKWHEHERTQGLELLSRWVDEKQLCHDSYFCPSVPASVYVLFYLTAGISRP